MRHAHLAPLVLVTALLLGCTRETSVPKAGATASADQSAVPVASPVGSATITPAPPPFPTPARTTFPTPIPTPLGYGSRPPILVFDTRTGELVRGLPQDLPATPGFEGVSRDARGIWVRTATSVELQTFDGKVLESLPLTGRPWVFSSSDDAQVRIVADDSGYFLWTAGATLRPVPGWHHQLSRDGRSVAYLETPGRVGRAYPVEVPRVNQLWIADTATLSPRLVTDLDPCLCDRPYSLSWSPSGRYLVFSYPGEDVAWVYDAIHDRLAELRGVFQDWAPNRDTLVFSRQRQVWVRDMLADHEQLARGDGGGGYGFSRFVSDTELAVRPSDYLASLRETELIDLSTMRGETWATTSWASVARRGDRLMITNLEDGGCPTVAILGSQRELLQCMPGDGGSWSPNGNRIAAIEGANCRDPGPAPTLRLWLASVPGQARILSDIDASFV